MRTPDLAHLETCMFIHCDVCTACHGVDAELSLVSADLGEGAFLKVLCPVCWHRLQYRAELRRRSGTQSSTALTPQLPGRRARGALAEGV